MSLWFQKRYERRERLQLFIHSRKQFMTHQDQEKGLKPMKDRPLSEADISGVIEMALSDHVSFETIKNVYGLTPDEVKTLMRKSLKAGSYRAWRKRVSDFGARRARYKSGLPLSAAGEGWDEDD
jgi:uncharacterized protein (TIGR03643 family)